MLDILPRRSALTVALGCALALPLSTPSQAAGLLDFLFGSQTQSQPQPQPQAAPTYGESPLRMRVQPRSFERRMARPKLERGEKVERSAKRAAPKPVLATPIDPKANPGWYLDDPTLRKGDIVVLKGKVLVYEGKRGPSSSADFASLQDTKLVSKVERERIQGMAGLQAATPTAAAPTPAASVVEAKTATVVAAGPRPAEAVRLKQVSLQVSPAE